MVCRTPAQLQHHCVTKKKNSLRHTREKRQIYWHRGKILNSLALNSHPPDIRGVVILAQSGTGFDNLISFH